MINDAFNLSLIRFRRLLIIVPVGSRILTLTWHLADWELGYDKSKVFPIQGKTGEDTRGQGKQSITFMIKWVLRSPQCGPLVSYSRQIGGPL